jgi:serine/threonine protein kinase/tetratricopeptide (TPR) repeat protein
MNDSAFSRTGSWLPGLARQLNQICDRFEAAWQTAGQPNQGPRLEEFLPAYLSQPERQQLLKQLLGLDLDYRGAKGERPTREEYCLRFPGDVEQIIAFFFEDAWRSARQTGQRPRLEDYLAENGSEAGRSALIRELLLPELEYRAQSGDQPTPEEYWRRLPQHVELINSVFDQVRRARPAEKAKFAETLAETIVLPGPAEWPTIPGYEILSKLDEGGMGVIYKARQAALKRVVALKMIVSGAYATAHERARFRLDAQLLAELQHPNIVQIHAVGEHEGLPYFAMEFMEGGSLSEKIKGKPQPPEEAARLMETLARAVHAAHEHGIIHRDLKPGNVLLTPPDGVSGPLGIPKVTDFGLAKRLEVSKLEHPSQDITRSNMIMGTPAYMAPEQARGELAKISTLTDVHALGTILYEMLTGRPPFKGNSQLDTLEQVRFMEPVPPRRFGLKPQVPRALETICLKCLQKEPHRRYESAKVLADDLRRFLNGELPLAQPTTTLERVVKWTRRKPAAAALVGVSMAAVLSLLVVSLAFNAQLQSRNRELRREQQKVEETEAREREGLRLLNVEVMKSVDAGHDAFSRKDWSAAKIHFGNALTKLERENALASLRDDVSKWLREATSRVQDEGNSEKARKNYEQFVQLQGRALFYGTGLIEALPANLEATKAAAKDALRLGGIQIKAASLIEREVPELKRYYTDEQWSEIESGCHELLLILAEAVAQSPPEATKGTAGHFRDALRILEQAAKLKGKPNVTKALRLRRAKYLEQCGQEQQAKEERALANSMEPQSPADYFLVGEKLFREAQLKPARIAFEEALRKKPNHFWAHYYLALCHWRLRSLPEARTFLTSCLSLQPEYVWVYLLLGSVDGELKDIATAEADFEQALTLLKKARTAQYGSHVEYAIYVNRGVMRIGAGKLVEAVGDLTTAIKLHTDQFAAYLNLARAYQEQAHRKAETTSLFSVLAASQFSSSIAALATQYCEWTLLMDKAERQLDTAIESTPDVPPSLYRAQAQLHRERRQLNDALDDISSAIEKDAPKSASQAENYAEQSRIYFDREEYSEALESSNMALNIGTEAEYYLLHGNASLQLKDFGGAIQSYTSYLDKGGKLVVGALRARGLARMMEGDYAAAIGDYRQVLRYEDSSEIRANCGWAYLLNSNAKEALSLFEKAIKLNPKNADAHSGRGFVLVITKYEDTREEAKKVREAVHEAETALQCGPTNQRMVYNTARIFAQAAGKLDDEAAKRLLPKPRESDKCQRQAVKCLSQALNLSPPGERYDFWKDYVQEDHAFDRIRANYEFARLMPPEPQKSGLSR